MNTVVLSGIVGPRGQVTVGFAQTVPVQRVLVAVGDCVQSGEPLARIASHQLELRIANMRAELTQAQDALNEFLTSLLAPEPMVASDGRFSSQANVSLGTWTVRQAAVEQAKTRLDAFRQRLEALCAAGTSGRLIEAKAKLAEARTAVAAAEQELEHTRQAAIQIRKRIAQEMMTSAQELARARLAYNEALWEWRVVQHACQDPLHPLKIPSATEETEHTILSEAEREGFRRALIRAEWEININELKVQNLVVLIEHARAEEMCQVAQAEHRIEAARRLLYEAEEACEREQVSELKAALHEAFCAFVAAELVYLGLVGDLAHRGLQSELETAHLGISTGSVVYQLKPCSLDKLAQVYGALDQARAALAAAEIDLMMATLTAPCHGTITAIDIISGRVATPADTITITDLNGVLVRGRLAQADVERVRPGQRVTISADGSAEKRFHGVIARSTGLSEQSQDQLEAWYRLEIDVDGGAPLWAGSSSAGRIEITVSGE